MSASRTTTARVGMVVFLGSWAMSFAAMLFSFGIVREGSRGWPPAALAEIPAHMPLASTLVVIASSAALEWGRRSRRPAPIAAAAALGAAFLALQARLAWALADAGLDLGEPVGSMIYALGGFHAAHVGVGTLGLAGSAIGCRARRRRGDGMGNALELWSMFWHFVGATWLAICASVFVL